MKIYTRRGDKGETDLFGGERVSKTHTKVRAYGNVDAANSAIGFVAACHELPAFMRDPLHAIMSDLFDLGAELATSDRDSAQEKLESRLDTQVSLARVTQIEHFIDAAEAKLPELKTFVLPTGSEPAARFHLARTAVRRAEQSVILLRESGYDVRDEIVTYLNRLSDLMFIWARLSNLHLKQEDVPWKALKGRS